jgi:hypothetical protein
MKKLTFIAFVLLGIAAYGQADSNTVTNASGKKVLVVPYAPMMYFSDADAHIAHFSRTDEGKVRNQIRLMLEKNVHHQLLAAFNAVSLMSATSLNAEEDLKKIYAATGYSQTAATTKRSSVGAKLFQKKDKKQSFFVNDSAVMLAEIHDPNLNAQLYKKYQHDYLLYIAQLEINTSNKNTIEWQKQQYTRSYLVHYNLWDNQGKLVLAETLTLNAGGENELSAINEKYMRLIGEKLKEILRAAVK